LARLAADWKHITRSNFRNATRQRYARQVEVQWRHAVFLERLRSWRHVELGRGLGMWQARAVAQKSSRHAKYLQEKHQHELQLAVVADPSRVQDVVSSRSKAAWALAEAQHAAELAAVMARLEESEKLRVQQAQEMAEQLQLMQAQALDLQLTHNTTNMRFVGRVLRSALFPLLFDCVRQWRLRTEEDRAQHERADKWVFRRATAAGKLHLIWAILTERRLSRGILFWKVYVENSLAAKRQEYAMRSFSQIKRKEKERSLEIAENRHKEALAKLHGDIAALKATNTKLEDEVEKWAARMLTSPNGNSPSNNRM